MVSRLIFDHNVLIQSRRTADLLTGYLLFTEVERTPEAPTLIHDFFLQERDGVDQLLGTGRTSRNIYIHRDHLVDALDQSVIVEYPARCRAGAHGDDPLRFRHLLPEL